MKRDHFDWQLGDEWRHQLSIHDHQRPDSPGPEVTRLDSLMCEHLTKMIGDSFRGVEQLLHFRALRFGAHERLPALIR